MAELHAQLATTLGRAYTVERELGGGGMARVFVATESTLGRRVVVKVLPPETSGVVSADRFRREVQLAARLQHPHIVPLLAAGETCVDESSVGLLYYIMPFVDGETLRARLTRDGALPIGGATQLFRDITKALAYAHRHGVAHRDIKPENVLLGEDGTALVADFGIAKALSAASLAGNDSKTLSTLGVVLGTPAYMAPEQAAGDPAADHRADLYSLGVLAYEMLAGSHPFAGRAPHALLAAHATETPESLVRRRPSVPTELAEIVMRLMEKHPADRPQSAESVLQLLDASAAQRSNSVEHVASAPPPTHRVRSRYRSLALAGLVLAALAGVGTWYEYAHSGAVDPAARRVLVVPFENATGDPALAPLGGMAADWIAQGLAKTNFLEVSSDVARPTTTGDSGLKVLAATNSAGTIVSGVLYQSNDSIRVQAHITGVAGWKLVPVDPVSASRASPPGALLEHLGQGVLAVLARIHDPRYKGWEMGSPPKSYAAYEEYLAGLDIFATGNWKGAIPHYARATAIDSTYVFPTLNIIQAFLNLGEDVAADSVRQLILPRQETLSPSDRAFFAYLQGWIDGDWLGALKGAQDMVTAAPGAQLPHYLQAQNAVTVNRPGEALEAAGHLSYQFGRWKSGWGSQIYWRIVTDAHHILGKFGDERKAAKIARTYSPDNREVLWSELRVLAAQHRVDDMRPLLDQLEGMPPPLGGRTLRTLLMSVAGELDAHDRSAESRAVLRRAVDWRATKAEIDNDDAGTRYDLLQAHYLLGDYELAESLATRLVVEQPQNPRYAVYEALIALRRDRRADATRVVERLAHLSRKFDRGETPYARAQIAAQLGDTAQAIALLNDAFDQGLRFDNVSNTDAHLAFSLHSDPHLAPLRADPRFKQLLRPKG